MRIRMMMAPGVDDGPDAGHDYDYVYDQGDDGIDCKDCHGHDFLDCVADDDDDQHDHSTDEEEE